MQALDLGRVVGMSAYELAVSKGYEGTLEAWLESLRYDTQMNISSLQKQSKRQSKKYFQGKKKLNCR